MVQQPKAISVREVVTSVGLAIAVAVCGVLLWEAVVWFFQLPKALLPTPRQVFHAAVEQREAIIRGTITTGIAAACRIARCDRRRFIDFGRLQSIAKNSAGLFSLRGVSANRPHRGHRTAVDHLERLSISHRRDRHGHRLLVSDRQQRHRGIAVDQPRPIRFVRAVRRRQIQKDWLDCRFRRRFPT